MTDWGITNCGISEQFLAAAICTAREAAEAEQVLATPGYYAIFIDDPCALPNPFQELLVERGTTRLIYIGLATVSLYDRLVKQDLRHQQPSTFFRGIGCVLNYRPPPGSLVGNKNQNNYRFSANDTAKIVEWIDEQLSVSWIKAEPALETIEECLIRKYHPLMNTKHNPSAIPELADLRRECRMIARAAK